MTRSELISHIAQHFPHLALKKIELAVFEIQSSLFEALVDGRRIEIRSFGSFDVYQRRSRKGRNPKSGERVWVPEKYTAHFKPGKLLKKMKE